MAVPEHDKSYQDKPLIAVLVSPDGPEEIWVLGRENGQAAPEDIELGNSWYERLRTLQAARQADFNQA